MHEFEGSSHWILEPPIVLRRSTGRFFGKILKVNAIVTLHVFPKLPVLPLRASCRAGLAMAATLTGCHIPANSPLTGLAQIRPVAPQHTNVLPPAAMLQHPGPGVDGPGPGVIAATSYEAALAASEGGAAAPDGGGMAGGSLAPTSQVGFIGPDGMQ
ncbi:MAG: hypothetical protein ACKOHK_12825, partial [Planctomycetia bacterium]